MDHIFVVVPVWSLAQMLLVSFSEGGLGFFILKYAKSVIDYLIQCVDRIAAIPADCKSAAQWASGVRVPLYAQC